jgi:hypothetical protein
VARRTQCLTFGGTIPFGPLGDLPALIVHEWRAVAPSQSALLAWGRERFPPRHSRQRLGRQLALSFCWFSETFAAIAPIHRTGNSWSVNVKSTEDN